MTRIIGILKTGKVGVSFCTEWREHNCHRCKDSPKCDVIGKRDVTGKEEEQEKEQVQFT